MCAHTTQMPTRTHRYTHTHTHTKTHTYNQTCNPPPPSQHTQTHVHTNTQTDTQTQTQTHTQSEKHKQLDEQINCYRMVSYRILLLAVGCLMSQQHVNVSQGQIYSHNCMCCHTEKEVALQTFYLTLSQYTGTGPANFSPDPSNARHLSG